MCSSSSVTASRVLPNSVNAVFPAAIVQACVIHLIPADDCHLRYASRKYWDQLAKDLRAIYTAPNVDAAWAAFEELEEKWGKPYPGDPKLWRAAWEEFTPFLAYGGCREMARWTALFDGAAVSGGDGRAPGRGLRLTGWCQVSWARWILRRLKAVAARWSSLVAWSRPRRENRSRIFFRLPMPGSTVAPRRLYSWWPWGVRSRWAFACRGVAPGGGGPCAGSAATAWAWSLPLPCAMSRSGPATFRFASLL